MPAATPETLTALMARLAIDYQVFEHPPLHTCQDADRLSLKRPGTRLKHLFLRDNYGRQHFLLVTRPDKAVDLKQLSRQFALSRLGFASAERLQRYLGIAPGCVSLLALINDTEKKVGLWLDEEICAAAAFQCHPLVNTRTWVIPRQGIERFLDHTGHRTEVVVVPAR